MFGQRQVSLPPARFRSQPPCEAGALWQDGLTGEDILSINKPLSYLQELFSYRAERPY